MTTIRQFLARHTALLFVVAATVAALWLRLYHLGFQSLWVDEIHSAIESDPAFRDKSFWFYLRNIDQQPPLFFWLERIGIGLFGNNEFGLRFMPALAGTVSIYVIFLLGRELMNVRMGAFAAAMMAVNYFSIYYSQEARPYALAVLFTMVSWLLLVRFIKECTLQRSLLYGMSVLLMLYTNYFTLFIAGAQVIAAFIFWTEEQNKKKFFLLFLLSGVLIVAGYIPWMSYLWHVSGMGSFWAAKPEENVGIDYFFGFFGHSDLLKPLLILLLIAFFLQLFTIARGEQLSMKSRPLVLIFVVCVAWIFVPFFSTYLRSLLLVPMMVPRYLIVVLPAFILLLAAGMESIKVPVVKHLLLVLFLVLSITHLFPSRAYYSKPVKSQFRELAEYMARDSFNFYPVISDKTCWHQQYYLKRYDYKGPMIGGKVERLADSMMKQAVHGFWITGGHAEPKPADVFYERLRQHYILLREVRLYDAWGQLFVAKANYPGAILIDAMSLTADARAVIGGEMLIPMWRDTLLIPPIELEAGKYAYEVTAYGTPVRDVYPGISCFVNDIPSGHFTAGKYEQTRSFSFSLDSTVTVHFRFGMANDTTDAIKKEDRNLFIKGILIRRQ